MIPVKFPLLSALMTPASILDSTLPLFLSVDSSLLLITFRVPEPSCLMMSVISVMALILTLPSFTKVASLPLPTLLWMAAWSLEEVRNVNVPLLVNVPPLKSIAVPAVILLILVSLKVRSPPVISMALPVLVLILTVVALFGSIVTVPPDMLIALPLPVAVKLFSVAKLMVPRLILTTSPETKSLPFLWKFRLAFVVIFNLSPKKILPPVTYTPEEVALFKSYGLLGSTLSPPLWVALALIFVSPPT